MKESDLTSNLSAAVASDDYPVRRISIISALILVLATSACVTGWGLDLGAHGTTRQSCARKPQRVAAVANAACSPVLKALSDKCGLRGFVPFHFATFQAVQVSAPLRRASKISSAFDSAIIVSSAGPPETDRGPPRS